MQDKPKRPSPPWKMRPPESEVSRAARYLRTAERDAANIEFVKQLKLSLGCADCGYREHAVALDFDHLPGTEKKRDIARSVRGTRGALLREIAKCEVVCSNCHRIRTWRRNRERVAEAEAEREHRKAATEAKMAARTAENARANSARLAEAWKKRLPEAHICTICGKEYFSRSLRQSFYCGKNCGMRAVNARKREARLAQEQEGRLF
jgi:hypothetical protein